MHAQVTKVKLRPGTMKQAADEWRESLLPALEHHERYRGVLFLSDEARDEGYAIVLFDDASAPAEAHQDDKVQSALRSLSSYFAAPPEQGGFDVALDQRR